jgi:hypothetical protein
VFVHAGSIHKDLWIDCVEGSDRDPKEPLQAQGDLNDPMSRPQPEGWGSASSGIRAQKKFFSFCSERKGEILQPCHREEEIGQCLIQ